MIENARLSIFDGGYYRCTPAWNRDEDSHKFARLFAYFMPVEGEAFIETVEGKHRLEPGHLYFIPIFHILRQTCEREMWAYWVSFVSESFYLHYRLMGIRGVRQWPLAAVPGVESVFRRFVEFFDDPETDWASLPKNPPAGLSMLIEGTLTALTGMLMEATQQDFNWGDYAGLERLKPAIDFMDDQFLRNPSLADIAQKVKLTPNYFHRFFKERTGLTAFKYMENRRLDLAHKLLLDRQLNITEVAHRTGYPTLGYFSQAFRRRFGFAPSEVRRNPQAIDTRPGSN